MVAFRKFTVSLWIAMAVGSSLGLAQVSGGAFRGQVLDPSGAGVSLAEVVIRSDDSGMLTSVQSNEYGLYITPTLIPGSYSLSAVKNGFRKEIFGPVTLEVNQTVRIDFLLSIGQPTETVEVEASGTQLLSPESAEISQVIGSKQVSELALNGRSWQQLIDLSAGVNPGAPGESGSPNPVNINGQRTKANLYMVDGISTTLSSSGRANDFNMPLDAVREFSVQAGSYSAEYGNVAGGVVNLQSKSGANQWHGSAFEFLRNDALDASNFFSNLTGQPKNPLRYNQFGGETGGPIRHDKTFIFGDYQSTLAHNAQPMVTTVPLSSQRTGNFAGPTPIYNPFSPGFVRQPFPNNQIPVTRLDPAAINLSAALPSPNQFDSLGRPLAFNNYAVTRTLTSDQQAFDLRLDHQFSQKHNIFVRHSFQNTSAFTPSIFGLPLGGSLAGSGATVSRNQNAGVGFTSQIRANWINEFRAGFNRQTSALRQEDYGLNLSQQFGIPGVNRDSQSSGLSTIAIAGLFNLGSSLLTPLRLASTGWSLSNKTSWVKGRHVLKIGAEYAHEMGSAGYVVYGRGFYTFLNLSTSSLFGPPGGNAYASFLVGDPYQVLRDEFPPGLVGLLVDRAGVFLQDDFKVSAKLTVNLGLRYDVLPYPREMHNRLSNFDPATSTVLIAGQNTSERLVKTDFHDIAPRIGLAYSPNAGTVIRAGYGIGYIDPLGAAGVLNSNEFNTPFYYLGSITQFPFLAPQYTLSSSLPGLVMPSATAPTGNQRYIVPTDRNQYSQTWSFTIQRAVGPSLMLEAAYVGTSGNRLLTAANLNGAPPGATDPTTRQPFPLPLSEIRMLSNSAHSTYHGLQTKAERRFTKGLYFLAAYTWSKSIDDQSNGTDNSISSGQYPQDPLHASLDRGLSSFDRTHRLTGSVVWAIPFHLEPNGRPALRSVTKNVLGGWQVSGIFVAQSGSPFSVLMSCADVNAQGNNCRPNRLESGALDEGSRSINSWFDTSAFAIPTPAAYGNAGRNIVRAPGLNNIDIALSKSFRWGGDSARRLQIRSEYFNILNHTNLGVPVNSIDSPAFGTITSASPSREIQLGARLEF